MSARSLEARVYVVACLAGLAPVAAAGLWRPLVAALAEDPTGRAPRLAAAAVVAGVLAALAGIKGARGLQAGAVAIAGVLGLGGVGGAGAAVTLGLVAAGVGLAAPRMLAAMPPGLGGLARRHPLAAASWAALVLVMGLGTARLSVFMADASFGDYATPGPEFVRYHLCQTAYLHAAELVSAGIDNVYDLSLTPGIEQVASGPHSAHMAPFNLDRYGYPPQFILVPLALIEVFRDFASQRAVWFALNALFVAWARWRMVLWAGPVGGRAMLLFAPIGWALSNTTYQIGNIQLMVECGAVLAMMAAARGRDARGGGLLAAVTLAKITPGLLGVMLLVQRRWAAVAWTAGVAAALSAVSVAVLGWGPFDAFLHDYLPRVSTGEAYDFLAYDNAQIAANSSPFATPFKLHALGVALDPWVWGPRAASLFTVGAFALAALAGRRRLHPRGQLALWLTIFTAASLRSPVAPAYVLTGMLWAIYLVIPELRGWRAWAVWLGTPLLGLPLLPSDALPVWVSLAIQPALFALMVWLVVRRWAPVEGEAAA